MAESPDVFYRSIIMLVHWFTGTDDDLSLSCSSVLIKILTRKFSFHSQRYSSCQFRWKLSDRGTRTQCLLNKKKLGKDRRGTYAKLSTVVFNLFPKLIYISTMQLASVSTSYASYASSDVLRLHTRINYYNGLLADGLKYLHEKLVHTPCHR